MNKFKIGQKLEAVSSCDTECVFNATVTARTEKTITIHTPLRGRVRREIHLDIDGNEFIYPFGQYSMAPIFRAPAAPFKERLKAVLAKPAKEMVTIESCTEEIEDVISAISEQIHTETGVSDHELLEWIEDYLTRY